MAFEDGMEILTQRYSSNYELNQSSNQSVVCDSPYQSVTAVFNGTRKAVTVQNVYVGRFRKV